jgi:hypothetical protein
VELVSDEVVEPDALFESVPSDALWPFPELRL